MNQVKKIDDKTVEIDGRLFKLEEPDVKSAEPALGYKYPEMREEMVMSCAEHIAKMHYHHKPFDIASYEMGEIHPNDEKAIAHRTRLRSTKLLEDCIAEVRGDWKPNFKDRFQPKYFFACHVSSGRIRIVCWHEIQYLSPSLYLKTKEQGQYILDHLPNAEQIIKSAIGVI